MPAPAWSRLLTTVVLGVAMCLLLPACGGTKVTKENCDKIKKDQTEADVKGVLGEPTKTEEVDVMGVKGKEWTWKSGDNEIKVNFLNGKVVEHKCTFK